MEQPSLSAGNQNNSKEVVEEEENKRKKKMKRMASPKEMVSHYEKQGMETQEASLRVIQDLQGALFRMMMINRKNNNKDVNSSSNSSSTSSSLAMNNNNNKKQQQLDTIHSRLLQLEMKVDTKPGYPHSLALGVSSLALWNAALQLWNTLASTSNSN